MPDTYHWKVCKIQGIARESLRRTFIGSNQHAINSILSLFKKYSSGKAIPNSGRFRRKTCTRKWRGTALFGLHLRPLINNEHSIVSKMREEFRDLAKPNQEQLLALEAPKRVSEKCHQGRKQKEDHRSLTSADSSTLPPRLKHIVI